MQPLARAFRVTRVWRGTNYTTEQLLVACLPTCSVALSAIAGSCRPALCNDAVIIHMLTPPLLVANNPCSSYASACPSLFPTSPPMRRLAFHPSTAAQWRSATTTLQAPSSGVSQQGGQCQLFSSNQYIDLQGISVTLLFQLESFARRLTQQSAVVARVGKPFCPWCARVLAPVKGQKERKKERKICLEAWIKETFPSLKGTMPPNL